jgi:hypothetical protein
MRRVRDVDVAAGAPNEVSRRHLAFVIGQRSLKHEGLFQVGVLVERHHGARSHPEKDRRTALIVLVQYLHFDAVEVGRLPRASLRRPRRWILARADCSRLLLSWLIRSCWHGAEIGGLDTASSPKPNWHSSGRSRPLKRASPLVLNGGNSDGRWRATADEDGQYCFAMAL